MKKRLVTRWTLTRVIYTILGLFVTIQSYNERQWLGMVLGMCFAGMGLFAVGCAAGTCFGNFKGIASSKTVDVMDIEFEEVK